MSLYLYGLAMLDIVAMTSFTDFSRFLPFFIKIFTFSAKIILSLDNSL